MAQTKPSIQFDHMGIGHTLNDRRLAVPVNQREYAWEEEQIAELFQDFQDAETSSDPEYFLGTIVLTQGQNNVPEVADGQQRLATVTILLAAIRDFLYTSGDRPRAETIETNYLMSVDLRSVDTIPRLRLNLADNDFFRKRILERPDSLERQITPTKRSHEKIKRAAELAQEQVQRIVAGHKPDRQAERLIDWVEFIRDKARVILVTVPDQYDPFRMFETLNDRGLPLAQSDLLKNYLLGRAGDRDEEVQQRWNAMVGALETVSSDEIVVTYLRHHYITGHGHTRERELYAKIRGEVKNKQGAITFADALADNVSHYVALLNPHHEKWNTYGTTTRGHVATLLELRVEQIRPLLLAVARSFSVEETRAAFRLFVSWSVRLLIGGGSRGGRIDRDYAERAKEVGTGKISTTKQLAKAMLDIIPSDADFETNFSVARISRSDLARYVLRALETKAKRIPDPELVANDDEEVVNLEHVLPLNPGPGWKMDADQAATLHKRIGNLALLQAKVNVEIGNGSFADKLKHFKKSAFVLTADVGAALRWDATAIDERQKKLAKLAVETWPISVS